MLTFTNEPRATELVNHPSVQNQNTVHNDGPQSVVVRAQQIIEAEYRSDLTLGGIARRTNISAGHFSTLFKKGAGLSFTDYVARCRVERAKQLLRNPNYRISEVAFEVGFQSISQFNRTFRRLVGSPPRGYRFKQSSACTDAAISRKGTENGRAMLDGDADQAAVKTPSHLPKPQEGF
jgi:AraC-like DNA-binding protein